MQLSNGAAAVYDRSVPGHTPSLLTRLRRHCGLWVVVALVLLFKLASSSVCLGDVPAIAQDEAGTAVVAVSAPASSRAVPDGGHCLLGEAECHGVCAHALSVPAAASAIVVLQAPGVAVLPATDGLRIGPIDLPLRPPAEWRRAGGAAGNDWTAPGAIDATLRWAGRAARGGAGRR